MNHQQAIFREAWLSLSVLVLLNLLPPLLAALAWRYWRLRWAPLTRVRQQLAQAGLRLLPLSTAAPLGCAWIAIQATPRGWFQVVFLLLLLTGLGCAALLGFAKGKVRLFGVGAGLLASACCYLVGMAMSY